MISMVYSSPIPVDISAVYVPGLLVKTLRLFAVPNPFWIVVAHHLLKASSLFVIPNPSGWIAKYLASCCFYNYHRKIYNDATMLVDSSIFGVGCCNDVSSLLTEEGSHHIGWRNIAVPTSLLICSV